MSYIDWKADEMYMSIRLFCNFKLTLICFRILGVFWKSARIGERLSPFVGVWCVAMAFGVLFIQWALTTSLVLISNLLFIGILFTSDFNFSYFRRGLITICTVSDDKICIFFVEPLTNFDFSAFNFCKHL